MDKKAQWTILVYINAKNNLEPFAFDNFKQMSALNNNDNVNIIVEMGRPKVHHTTEYGAWSKTLRFQIKKDLTPDENNALEDLGDVDMGNITTLKDFVQWGQQKFPAQRTMLVVWNHGQGWRLRQAVRIDSGNPSNININGAFRSVSNDDDYGSKLYNRAIQDELSKLPDRLDIIAFDACLMAMVETTYALRDVAKIMVGSEEVEPGSGWNYSKWLKQVIDNGGDCDAEIVSKFMVDAMRDEYGDEEATTLSSIDLTKVKELSAAISHYAVTAINVITPENAREFSRLRNECGVYGKLYGMHSVDIGRYMDLIISSQLDLTLRNDAKEVRNLLNSAVKYNYSSYSRKGKFGSNGLAIYFPANAAKYISDRDRDGYDPDNKNYPVEFVKTERWVKFLQKYWDLVPN